MAIYKCGRGSKTGSEHRESATKKSNKSTHRDDLGHVRVEHTVVDWHRPGVDDLVNKEIPTLPEHRLFGDGPPGNPSIDVVDVERHSRARFEHVIDPFLDVGLERRVGLLPHSEVLCQVAYIALVLALEIERAVVQSIQPAKLRDACVGRRERECA